MKGQNSMTSYAEEQVLKNLSILSEIGAERTKRDTQFGEQNYTPIEWLAILGEELGKANRNALQAHFCGAHINSDNAKYQQEQLVEYRKELVQIAAIAVGMIQSFDRNEKP